MRAPVLVQAHRHAAEGSKLHQLLRPRIMRCPTRCTNQHRAAWIRALVETRRWQPHGRPDVGPQLPTSGRPLNRPAPTPRHSPTIARRRQIAVAPTLCALAPTCVTPRARADAAARIAKFWVCIGCHSVISEAAWAPLPEIRSWPLPPEPVMLWQASFPTYSTASTNTLCPQRPRRRL